MSDDWDSFVAGLQRQIFEDTRHTYGQVAYERWLAPKYAGLLPDADGHGRVTGPCGDTMQIFLIFTGGRVSQASFVTDGCGSSTVCGSFAAELALGKTPDEVADVSGDTILEMLGGLPAEDRHCAFLAAETLQAALHGYMTAHRR